LFKTALDGKIDEVNALQTRVRDQEIKNKSMQDQHDSMISKMREQHTTQLQQTVTEITTTSSKDQSSVKEMESAVNTERANSFKYQAALQQTEEKVRQLTLELN